MLLVSLALGLEVYLTCALGPPHGLRWSLLGAGSLGVLREGCAWSVFVFACDLNEEVGFCGGGGKRVAPHFEIT